MNEPKPVFDRVLLRERRRRAVPKIREQDYLLQHISHDLFDRLSVVNRAFSFALDLGCHHGVLHSALSKLSKINEVVALDSCNEMISTNTCPKVVADEEILPFADNSFDLIFSGLSLQWVNDLPGCLIQVRRCLREDGLFIAAVLGGDSLIELRHSFIQAEEELYSGASPRVAPFANVRTLGNLLQRAGFALPVIDRDVLTVRYDSALHLMNELKAMGASNVLNNRHKRLVSRGLIEKVDEIYKQNFSDDDGRVTATFEFIYMMGWAPHSSQQQPLRPGSATVSLTEIFET